MKELIINKLHTLEKEYSIKILHACETGSRAWGFPSPDSDYDVRMIYVHDLEWYLSIGKKKDTLNFPIDEHELDITGWELKKSLGLMHKSNASLFERLRSPIVYISDPNFRKDMIGFSNKCFSPIATMHHYLSLGKSSWEECRDGAEVKLKRYFYAIRAAVCCKWVLERNEIPHIVMREMFSILSDELVKKLDRLIELKSTKSESYMYVRDVEIDDFIVSTIESSEAVASDLKSGNSDIASMEKYFSGLIINYHDDSRFKG
ncbi:nucleotidyltransferase domain-containing protein [Reichenbachiella versicolor]|uniref:nucleotidyltransferase domain-containing protein n=1 Tax=Reichenbachiella versicolor TaxID=1821036 RepID=UPI0013A5BBBE|nr:nucleotidyltransferase domain-containing protein [Reichenbachiella versicolor]